MKNHLLLTCIAFFIMSINSSVNAQGDSNVTEIKKLFTQQEIAWNKGDIPAFMETYWKSDQLVFLGETGPIYGWQKTLERYYRKYSDRQKMGHLEFDIERVDKRSSKVYSVIGKYHLSRDGIEDLEGHFLILVKNIEDRWLIVADSTH